MRSIQKTNISFLNAILQPNPELSGMETFKHQVFFHKYASISETEIDIFTYLGLRWHWKAENPAFEVTVDTDEPKLVNNEKSKEPHGKKGKIVSDFGPFYFPSNIFCDIFFFIMVFAFVFQYLNWSSSGLHDVHLGHHGPTHFQLPGLM